MTNEEKIARIAALAAHIVVLRAEFDILNSTPQEPAGKLRLLIVRACIIRAERAINDLPAVTTPTT